MTLDDLARDWRLYALLAVGRARAVLLADVFRECLGLRDGGLCFEAVADDGTAPLGLRVGILNHVLVKTDFSRPAGEGWEFVGWLVPITALPPGVAIIKP